MTELSPIANAIRHHKLNADGTEISMTEVFQIVDGAVNEIWAL